MTTAPSLTRLLRPRSIAIIGASDKKGALGASLLTNLLGAGYSGDIHLVNPKRAEIAGRPCVATVAALPAGIHVAVLAIPRTAVLETLAALAARRTGAAIIFSAGFAEDGPAGLAEQHQLAAIARAAGMAILGPNCLGLMNFVDRIPLTFVEVPIPALAGRPGIGIVSQSGALAAVLGVTLLSRELGLSYSVSTGNEAGSGVEDYVDYLIDDPDTRVIALIVELFRQPARFLAAAARATAAGKPIVLLHPGRSTAARASAATHTGAMAGDYQVMAAKVARAGVILVETLEELGDVAELLLRCPPAPAGGTAVLTESGAYKALTLDLAEHIGLHLPPITDADSPALRAAMPAFVPVSNPLDLTAQGLVDPGLYGRLLTALLHDPRFGSVLFGIIQTDLSTCDLKLPPIIAAARAQPLHKPVVFAGLDEGAPIPRHYVATLRGLGVPYFPTGERAVRALSRLAERAARDLSTVTHAPLALGALPASGGVMPEYRAKTFLAEAGVRFPAARLAATLAEAHEAASAIGYPVVLKAQSADLPHKTEAGGVIVGLTDAAALEAGWSRLADNIARHRPGLVLDGVLVEKMGARGIELILGARHHPGWGPVILVGFGGIQAEILHDVRLLPPDLPTPAILAELARLKSAALLSGFRGAPSADLAAVAELVGALGRLMLAEPRLIEIDLNPVVVFPAGQGLVCLDALIQCGPAT